ncbi:hypothetical protein Tsubulata_048471 [Turnera subulata]|uniref:Uncharacterized protein n=1 Tax=Turnera subulata TaxID=218843 RepID=A0A9Q0G922_9ROSI|nr:hypothetical protein Tsubulata_048471 [Turnera subulata]
MTTHLLIMYSLALCSLRALPSPLLDSLLFEPPMLALLIFIFNETWANFSSSGGGN